MTTPDGPNRKDLLWLAVVCLAMTLYFLGPALDGDAFVSTEVVHRYTPPWSLADAPEGPPHNDYLSDHATYHAWNGYTRDRLRAGDFPLWSGHSFGGVPYFGNFSVALLSPFTWMFVLWPSLPAAYAWVAAGKWLFAALGVFLFARRMGLSGSAAVLPALAYGFGGYQVVWVNAALTHVSAWAPWCLLAADRAMRRPDRRGLAWLAAVWCLQMLGGHPESSFYLVLGSGLYGLFRGRESGAGGRGLAVLAAAGGLTLLLSAVQLGPFLEYTLQSEGFRLRGADPYRPPVAPLSWGGLPLLAVVLFTAVSMGRSMRRARWWQAGVAALVLGVTLRVLGCQSTALLMVLPDLFGNPLDGGQYLGPLTYTDVAGGFCGGVTVLLAWCAIVDRRREVRLGALLWPALILAARAWRLPYLSQLLDQLPVFRETAATRALGMASLFLALLAGFGLRSFVQRSREFVAPGLLLLVLMVGLAAPVESWRSRTNPAPTVVTAEAGFLGLPRTEVASAAGASQWSMTLQGLAPAHARKVAVRVGALGLGEALAPTLTGAAPWPFEVVWVGTARLEEGRYTVEACEVLADGTELPFATSHLDLLRPYRPSWRWLVFAGALLFWLMAAFLPGRVRGGWVVATIGLELCAFGGRYNDFTPVEQLPKAVPPVDWLQEHMEQEGPFRFLGARTAIQPNLQYLFGLQALRGYDAIEPLAYTSVLRHLFEQSRERLWVEQDFSTMALDSPLADVLNLRFVYSAEAPDPGWVERTRTGAWAVYENVDVLPRAYTVQRAYSVAEHGAPPPLDTIRDQAVWEGGVDWQRPGAGQVEEFEYQDGLMRAVVTSDAGTILIVSEQLAPGWEARVDGAAAELRRTHGALMSVVLEPGRHGVELRYLPRSFLVGLGLSGLGLLLWLGCVLWPRRGVDRRGSSPEPRPIP